MGYYGLFWGFLFQFDFRLNGFDLLPDTIGYVLMAIGFNSLENTDESYFKGGRRVSVILAVLSIFDLVQANGIGLRSPTAVLFIVLGFVTWVMNAWLVHLICNGVARLAWDQNDYQLEQKALFRWKLYLGIVVGTPILTFFTLIAGGLALVMFIPFFIYTLIVLLLLMGLMKRADEAFR